MIDEFIEVVGRQPQRHRSTQKLRHIRNQIHVLGDVRIRASPKSKQQVRIAAQEPSKLLYELGLWRALLPTFDPT